MAELVASMSGVVLGGVVMVMGSSLTRGKIFTASIGSVDSFSYIYSIRSILTHTSNEKCFRTIIYEVLLKALYHLGFMADIHPIWL